MDKEKLLERIDEMVSSYTTKGRHCLEERKMLQAEYYSGCVCSLKLLRLEIESGQLECTDLEGNS